MTEGGTAARRVLIIKLGALGDVVMATALVDAIVRHHGVERCALLTTPPYAALFSGWPGLDIRTFERHGAVAMWRWLRYVRGGHFERIYDLQGNDRTSALCAMSGVAERVGNPARYPYTHHPATPWRGQSHIFERMVEVLAAAGVAVPARRPVIAPDDAGRQRVHDWLARRGLWRRPYVVMHAGASASRPEKRWPHFAELAAMLDTRGITTVWIGAGDERELNRTLAAGSGIDAGGVFALAELVELARHARAAVTNDSGPMHVLAAAPIPVFGLFGPSDWRRNHALGQREHVIACTELDPALTGRRTADCLRRIEPALVCERLAAAGVFADAATD